jgi:deoxyribonuclease IV
MEQRQVRVPRRRRPERVEDEQLLGGIRDVILAAHDVGDLGVEVVDEIRERVQHRPVGPRDHEVVHARVREPDLAADDVVEDRLALIGHVQAHGALALGNAPEPALEPVTLLVRLDVVGGGARVIGVPGLEQLLEYLAVARRSLGLEHRALVPIEVQPAQRVEDLLDVLGCRSLPIGIFDPQYERPRLAVRPVRVAAGEQPVIQGRPGTTDVKCPGRGWSETNAHDLQNRMLIGAHVSNAGGLDRAVQRGVERDCDAIQIFSQSPRMWRPTTYTEDDFAEFRESMGASRIKAVLIHAVYLINCATTDREMRKKSLASLTQSLRVGNGIGAAGVVLHAGSAKTGDVPKAIKRAGKVIDEALAETEKCPLHLEDTAGAGGTLGRSFEELEALLDASGGGTRLGICLDSCHLFASGYDVSTPKSLGEVVDEFDRVVGLKRLGSLHVNDSAVALGSNRDRHAIMGEGVLGEKGCAVILSEPRFDKLPSVLETGRDHGAPALEDVELAKKLRTRGKSNRRRAKR